MPYVPTSWSDNTSSPPAAWSGSSKVPAPWSEGITKHATVFTPVDKGTADWDINYSAPQTYFYNDTNMTYNDTNVNYNNLINNNQINQNLVSRWEQVV